ncbi:MAG TPA: PilZ domain-containing protein [Terriglobales bacterium]|nr:PilZ domain-containing protein [Terriglobales bacterium]
MSKVSGTSQPAAAPETGEHRRVDRRKHPRYSVNGGAAEVRQQGGGSRIWARFTDISLGGCYLEIMSPLPVLTYIRFVLTLGEQQVQGKGQVMASHPQFGVGVQFIDLSAADRQMLESWIARLAAPKAGPPVGRRLGESPARTLDKESAALLVQTVTEFFLSKPTMSREEFLQMVEARHKASKDGDGQAESLKPA